MRWLLLASVLAVAGPARARQPEGSRLTVRVFDGARRPLSLKHLLVRVIDGNHQQVYAGDASGSVVDFQGLPFHDNFGDDYTVLVSAKGWGQSGFFPVKLSPARPQTLDLMLLPKHPRFDFSGASWGALRPELRAALAGGLPEAEAAARWAALQKDKPQSAACLLNIAAALAQLPLDHGPALSYLRRVVWDDSMARDRFYAYAPEQLLLDVRAAASDGLFAREYGEGIFHPGAFESYKQVEFGEANVQLTFHPAQTLMIGGEKNLLVELDIDYYKDLLAHFLLEVIPNLGRHGRTDPRVAYQLRWIAGRREGRDFDPGYVLAP